MDSFFHLMPPALWLAAFAVAFVAGVIKGTVGFGMPMIMISGLSSFLAPELALAALIIPTLATNGWQALRQGGGAAWAAIRKFRVFLLCGLVTLLGAAQFVRILPQSTFFILIGVPVAGFALSQLLRWQMRLAGQSPRSDLIAGGVAGLTGGLAGIWGPPTVAYLTAINTPKAEQMRVQGTIYGLGAIALLGAHLQSGVLRAETLPLSVLMVVPALAGMMIGLRVQDRINQETFRKATLWVLLIVGLNLVRRGLTG